jgi:hypothetical protein
MRILSSSFTCFNLARSRFRILLRSTRNLPFFQACPQMWVKPSLRLALPVLLPTCCGKTPELNQARFVLMLESHHHIFQLEDDCLALRHSDTRRFVDSSASGAAILICCTRGRPLLKRCGRVLLGQPGEPRVLLLEFLRRQHFRPHACPLLIGVGLLFWNRRSMAGWVLAIAGALFILAGVIANMHIYFQPTSLFNTPVMLILFVGGLGLIARALSAHQTKSSE